MFWGEYTGKWDIDLTEDIPLMKKPVEMYGVKLNKTEGATAVFLYEGETKLRSYTGCAVGASYSDGYCYKCESKRLTINI